MSTATNTLAPPSRVDDATIHLCRVSLIAFIHNFDPLFKISDFSWKVAEALETFYNDSQNGKYPNLLLEAPPQHGKSTQVAVYFPAWLLGVNPNLKIVIATYSAELASDRCIAIQKIISSPFYQQIFPHTQLPSSRFRIKGKRDALNFELVNYRGGLKAVSTLMGLTGFSMDIGIIDDPYKDMDAARSILPNRRLKTWFEAVFLTRGSKKGGNVLMLTRWTTNDLAGDLSKRDDWKCLKFQAINPQGKALVPSLYSAEDLAIKKSKISSFIWQAMYQQNPQIMGGNLVKESWLQYYSILPEKFTQIFIVGDTAMKAHESCDFSVFTVWGESNNQLYLLDMWRGQVDSPDLKAAAIKIWEKWKPGINSTLCRKFYIEDKASGPGLIQELKRDSGIPLEGIPRSRDKFSRIQDVLPYIQSERLHLPENSPWTRVVVDELTYFTGVNDSTIHDDIVDTVIDALNIVYIQKKVTTMRDVLYSKSRPRRL